MKKKNNGFLPYGLAEAPRRLVRRLGFVFTLLPAGITLLLFFPLSTILTANRLTGVSSAVNFLSDLLAASGLFGLLALLALVSVAEEKGEGRRLLLWQSIASLGLGALGRLSVYLLLALAEEKLHIPLALTADTWRDLTLSGRIFPLLWFTLLSSFLPLLAVLLCAALGKKERKRAQTQGLRGKFGSYTLRLPALVYLGFSLIAAVVETAVTVSSLGFSFAPGTLLELFGPYVRLGLFTVGGYFWMRFVVFTFCRKTGALSLPAGEKGRADR